ncbi:MAG TPA: family 16 glycosylhydrolase [Alphaproteobacteria bacterium]|nr:family 16 glycosylhydrolase [Alphaproteobacteria bacterium]
MVKIQLTENKLFRIQGWGPVQLKECFDMALDLSKFENWESLDRAEIRELLSTWIESRNNSDRPDDGQGDDTGEDSADNGSAPTDPGTDPETGTDPKTGTDPNPPGEDGDSEPEDGSDVDEPGDPETDPEQGAGPGEELEDGADPEEGADPGAEPQDPGTGPSEITDPDDAAGQPDDAENGWVMTFEDNFDTLDRSTWDTKYPWGDRFQQNEMQFYSDDSVGVDPFSVEDGVLTIEAAEATEGNAGSQAYPEGLPYTSGLLSSHESFSQQYGYFEMNAKLPEGKGMEPAFGLLPMDQEGAPEADVMEIVGSAPSTLETPNQSNDEDGSSGDDAEAGNMSDGFHRYGLAWNEDEVILYFDGQEMARTDTPSDFHEPMYMLANLAVGGDGPGAADSDTQLPAEMEIDYIRAYQYADDASTDIAPPPPTATPATDDLLA